MTECLKIIEEVSTRIIAYDSVQGNELKGSKLGNLHSLPRIGVPMKEDSVTAKMLPPSTRRERIEASLGAVAKSYGDKTVQSTDSSQISPRTKEYLAVARNKLLTHNQQEVLSHDGVKTLYENYTRRFLESALGEPFHQTFPRLVASIAFGYPYTESVLVVDAIDSLTSLALASLSEDRYGKVAGDVPLILQTLIKTYKILNAFTSRLEIHWTDIKFHEEDRKAGDAGLVLEALRIGLTEIVDGFGPFAVELGLEDSVLRTAKSIIGRKD